jgi:hypothetical protein
MPAQVLAMPKPRPQRPTPALPKTKYSISDFHDALIVNSIEVACPKHGKQLTGVEHYKYLVGKKGG